ncbi:hypothetical protein D3C84_666670 [compost metagenome]
MAAAAYPAVEDHFELIADRIDDVGDQLDGGGAAVELATAMVGNNQPGNPGRGGIAGIADRLQSLDHKRLAPVLLQAFNSFPGDVLLHAAGKEGAQGA